MFEGEQSIPTDVSAGIASLEPNPSSLGRPIAGSTQPVRFSDATSSSLQTSTNRWRNREALRARFAQTLGGFVKASGIKQGSLAATAGIDSASLSKFIHGKKLVRGANTVLAIGEALRLDRNNMGTLLESAGYNPAVILEEGRQGLSVDNDRLKRIRAKVGSVTTLATRLGQARFDIMPLVDSSFPGDPARRLVAFMKINDISQAKFAHMTGIDLTLLNKILKGHRQLTIHKAQQIASQLGLKDQDATSFYRLFLDPKVIATVQQLQVDLK